MNWGSNLLGGAGTDAQAIGLDYPRLVASLAAAQATSRTATLDVRERAAADAQGPVEALVVLLAAEPGWASAVASLGGCFNPVVAQKLAETGGRAR